MDENNEANEKREYYTINPKMFESPCNQAGILNSWCKVSSPFSPKNKGPIHNNTRAEFGGRYLEDLKRKEETTCTRNYS